jgi:hypothetical protein
MAIRELTLEECNTVSGAYWDYFGGGSFDFSTFDYAQSDYANIANFTSGSTANASYNYVAPQIQNSLAISVEAYGLENQVSSGSWFDDWLEPQPDANSCEFDFYDNAAQYAHIEMWAYYDRMDTVYRQQQILTNIAQQFSNSNPGNAALATHQFAGYLINNGYSNLVSGYNASGVYNGHSVYTPGSSGYNGDEIVVTAGHYRDEYSVNYSSNFNFAAITKSLPPTFGLAIGPQPAIADSDRDGVTDDKDADPSNPNIQNEVVVSGIRQDLADEEERLIERQYYINNHSTSNSGFINAERLPTGEFIYNTTNFPTTDQLRFKHNFDTAKADLWGLDLKYPGSGSVVRIANALTNGGIDVVSDHLDLSRLHTEYGRLSDSGAVAKTMTGFVSWIRTTHLHLTPISLNLSGSDSSEALDNRGSQFADMSNYENYDFG